MERRKLPSFFKDFPEERIKELMAEEDDSSKNFNKVMDRLLHDKPRKLDRRKS